MTECIQIVVSCALSTNYFKVPFDVQQLTGKLGQRTILKISDYEDIFSEILHFN